jgi:hypothetical protein
MLEPEDVIRHLGKQEKHWKEGRSAHVLAQTWFDSDGLPDQVASVLVNHPMFASAALVDGFLERKVDLGTSGHPSQTDLLAIVALNDKLAVVAVEGKAGETFGDYVYQWSDGSESKQTRLKGLCNTLGLSCNATERVRYQLLHRAASAVYEARRYRTDLAALLVHSFSEDRSGFKDFSDFVEALGGDGTSPNTLAGPFFCEGVSLYLGWVQDEARKAPSPRAYLDELSDYASRLSLWCGRVRQCDKRKSAVG